MARVQTGLSRKGWALHKPEAWDKAREGAR